MAPAPDASSPYRAAPVSRALHASIGAAWTSAVLGTLVGLVLFGAAASTWWARCSVERTRRTWVHEGCVMHPEDRTEVAALTTTWFLSEAVSPVSPTDDVQVYGEHVRWSHAPGPMVLLVMALVAFAGPSLLTERARLTLDESDGKVRIRRWRLGHTETIERPLGELTEAVVARRGWATSVVLVFRGGERMELAAPTNGDGGHGALVRAVNTFLARA